MKTYIVPYKTLDDARKKVRNAMIPDLTYVITYPLAIQASLIEKLA